ncbi:MAG: hypothetical protein GOU97_02225 [Nanoarchaeota archaeon]|nr:hypothetical protein [Nanoarchaeota archaeon]
MKFEYMNTNEVKKINDFLEQRFGTRLEQYYYLKQRDRIWVFSGEHEKLEKLRPGFTGFRLGIIDKRRSFKPSQESSTLIKARKNVLEVSEKEARNWLAGKDLKKQGVDGWFLLRTKTGFFGVGKRVQGFFRNIVPKRSRVIGFF